MHEHGEIKGYAEHLSLGSGFVVIGGWIAREAGPLEGDIEFLHDGVAVARIGALEFRSDLAAAGIAGGTAHFHVSGPLKPNSGDDHKLSAVAAQNEVFEFPVVGSVKAFQPIGGIETVGPEGIIGWLFDPTVLYGEEKPFLLINGERKTPVSLEWDRFDLPYRGDKDYARWGFKANFSYAADAEGLEPIQVELHSSGQLVARWALDQREQKETLRTRSVDKPPEEKPQLLVEVVLGERTFRVTPSAAAFFAQWPTLIRPIPKPAPKTPPVADLTSPAALSSLQGKEVVSKPAPSTAVAAKPSAAQRPSLLVVSWDMGHNPVGRAFLLADIARRNYEARLTGPLFEQYGKSVWDPLKSQTNVPMSTFSGGDFRTFFETVLGVVEKTEAEIVYVSKARMPSLLFGILMRLLKGSALVVDIDDHELSFFRNRTPATLDEALAFASANPDVSRMPYDEIWTRLAESLVKDLPAVTVSNVALQQRFGGIIVRHARDELNFRRNQAVRERMRSEFGIGSDDVVVLFVGTPRPHKGIYRIAASLERINDKKLVFVMVGSFTDARTKAEFKKYKKAHIKFFDNQPWEKLPEIVSIADTVALLQDPSSAIADFQIPAKLTDAMALNIPVIATPVPPLQDLVSQGSVIPIQSDEELDAYFQSLLKTSSVPSAGDVQRMRFLTEFSYEVNAARLRLSVKQAMAEREWPAAAALLDTVQRLADHFGISDQLPQKLKKTAPLAPVVFRSGQAFDLVFFWKQNDTDIYGRRSDMMMKYLLRSGRVKRILQFDRVCSLSELERNLDRGPNAHLHQGNIVYSNTIRRMLRMEDTPQILKRTFVCRDGSLPQKLLGSELPKRSEYAEFVRSSLAEVGMDRSAVAWVCPVVREFPEIQSEIRFSRVIADVIDDQRKWQANPEHMRRVIENYAQILPEADLVLANCEAVRDGFADLRQDIRVIPNGAEVFDPQEIHPIPPELSLLPRPIVGYVGNLRDRIDLTLIAKVAQRHPTWSIVLIGSAHDAIDVIAMAKAHENIHLLGVKPYDAAVHYIANFDVAMMPHIDNALSQNMNPLKLYVYFALEVPVVTTEVANISDLAQHITVAASHEEFIVGLETTLASPRKSNHRKHASVVETVSWNRRVQDVLQCLDQG